LNSRAFAGYVPEKKEFVNAFVIFSKIFACYSVARPPRGKFQADWQAGTPMQITENTTRALPNEPGFVGGFCNAR
jgi:hypothetical protein